MQTVFEIHADEAWTHNSSPLKRYWCFIGGLLGSHGDLDRLEKAVNAIRIAYELRSEIKWSSVTADRLPAYKAIVDCLFHHLQHHDIRYRQIFLDRSFVHYETYCKTPDNLYSLDVQFKVYYQFIKHHFGIRHMPRAKSGIKLYIRLDDHSSQKHKDSLEGFVKDLPRHLDRHDIDIEVKYVNSARNLRVQLCDLLMGAAGSYGNKMHDLRIEGRRGMTPKQKVRLEFCQHVYNQLRNLSCGERGTKAFNWFESTGLADQAEAYGHKIRIWKFIPNTYLKDKGLENDNLGKAGLYLGPKIDPNVVFVRNRQTNNWERKKSAELKQVAWSEWD